MELEPKEVDQNFKENRKKLFLNHERKRKHINNKQNAKNMNISLKEYELLKIEEQQHFSEEEEEEWHN